MKFHHYLEEILGSRIKIQLLRTLHKFPDQGFGMRELASLLKIDHRSVSEAVKDFEKHNLVKVKVFGRSYAVYLNKTSFAYKKMMGLFEAEQSALDYLVDLIKKELSIKNIQTCALLGSLVETTAFHSSVMGGPKWNDVCSKTAGEWNPERQKPLATDSRSHKHATGLGPVVFDTREKPNSDVDLLIITNDKKKIEEKIGVLQEKVLTLFGNPLTPLILTKTEFKKTNQKLRENILKNNLLVHGKN